MKVSFFLWLAYWGRILTVDKIIARGILIPNRCLMCLMDEETLNHLLLQCPVALSIWNFFLSLFGRKWVLQGDFQDVIQEWSHSPVGYLSAGGKLLWKCIPFVVSWSIWKELNSRIFDNKYREVPKISDMAFSFLISWVSHLPEFSNEKFADWTFNWEALVSP